MCRPIAWGERRSSAYGLASKSTGKSEGGCYDRAHPKFASAPEHSAEYEGPKRARRYREERETVQVDTETRRMRQPLHSPNNALKPLNSNGAGISRAASQLWRHPVPFDSFVTSMQRPIFSDSQESGKQMELVPLSASYCMSPPFCEQRRARPKLRSFSLQPSPRAHSYTLDLRRTISGVYSNLMDF